MCNKLLQEKIKILEEENQRLSGLLYKFGQEADKLKEMVETDKILLSGCSHNFIADLANSVIQLNRDGTQILTYSICKDCGYVRISTKEL